MNRQFRHNFISMFFAAALLLAGTTGMAAPPPVGTVLRGTLENGLRVVIVYSPLAPVVTSVITYRVGSNEAPPGFPGMAHALEHMMFRGSPNLSAEQLAAISAAMGGDFNANTQQEVTQYFFTVPREDLPLALRVEAERMRGTLCTDALWSNERGAIEQEVSRDISSPDYVLYEKLLAALFKGTPYEHDALGTRPSFEATTGAMLKKFHTDWYKPNNAVLVIAGDVNPKTAMAEVERQFGSIRPGKLPSRPAIKLQPVKPELLQLTTDQPNGQAVIAFRFPGTQDGDFAAANILADVLGNKRGRLYGLVPAGKALDVGFSYYAMGQSGLGYLEAQFPKGGDGKALLEEMKKAVEADLHEGFSAELIEAEKQREVGNAEFQKNSISGLAMSWAQAVAIERRYSPLEDIENFRAVTRTNLIRVAYKYLDFDQALSAVLTPESSGKPVSSQGFGGRESLVSAPTKPVKLPYWASSKLEKLTVPESSLHPVMTVLSNGLKLIVQPLNINNTISLAGRIQSRPELQTPSGQEGVGEVLDRFFDYGTRTLDRLAFQKALDDIGAFESGGTDFSLQVLADKFERGLELVADHERQPAFPEEAFKIIQEQVAGSVAGRLHSPDYLNTRALLAAIYPAHDPKLRQATPDTVNALKLENVREYHRQLFRPDLTTIVIAGNISPEKARTLVEKYFGDWKAVGPKPVLLLPPVPPNPSSAAVVPDESRVQDSVILAVTMGLTRTNADYYALELGNHVLGGGFYATRLYRDLRKNAGLVYSVESSLQIEMTRAIYLASYACDPANVSKARALVERNLKEMQTSLISAEELHQAKAQMMREIPLGEADIGSIMGGLIYRSTHDLPLNEPTLAAQRYLKMTAADIKAAYAKWLRPGDLVQITQGPPPE